MGIKLHIIRTLAISFSLAICGISSLWAETVVDVQQAGSLSSLLTSMEKEVRLTGYINGSDVKYLREQINGGNITSLNLSDVSIVSGGDAYYEDYKTSDGIIGDYMFNQCGNLEHVVLPNNISEISSKAFSRTGLKKIEIPDNVSTLGFDAFAYCSSLDTVVLGKKVKTLNQGVFYGSSVKKAYVRTSFIPAISYYLFSSSPTICVYSDLMDDFIDSDWNEFGTIVGELETIYAQDIDPSITLRSLMNVYFADNACTELKSEYASMDDATLTQTMTSDGVTDDLINIALNTMRIAMPIIGIRL